MTTLLILPLPHTRAATPRERDLISARVASAARRRRRRRWLRLRAGLFGRTKAAAQPSLAPRPALG
jgi:hypothetical protein